MTREVLRGSLTTPGLATQRDRSLTATARRPEAAGWGTLRVTEAFSGSYKVVAATACTRAGSSWSCFFHSRQAAIPSRSRDLDPGARRHAFGLRASLRHPIFTVSQTLQKRQGLFPYCSFSLSVLFASISTRRTSSLHGALRALAVCW